MIFLWSSLSAQKQINGEVSDGRSGNPLEGVRITTKNPAEQQITDENGAFKLTVQEANVTLVFALPGYETQKGSYTLPFEGPLHIFLHEKVSEIEEVTLTTGYQKIPKERSTGSFSTISNETLNKQVSVNILDRLTAAANGVVLSQGTNNGENQLMIRGLSTIKGPKSPLIVVDQFPYEGDISNINPNIIENITILKDAAASSIWGARAANGVIIITTKKGSFKEALSVDINTSLSISQKPNLDYISTMSSANFMEVEQELFKRGFYDEDLNSPIHPVLSPVVMILNKEKLGKITPSQREEALQKLRNVDVRDQYSKYMYVPSENRQYAVNLSAGSEKLLWSAMLGYDDNIGNLDERYKRLNVRFQNTWKPLKKLTVNTGMWLNQTQTQSGRYGYGSVVLKNNGLPYLQFADQQGNPLSVPKEYNQDYKLGLGAGKLLDWNYYPLTNWQHEFASAKGTELILNAGINYKIAEGISADISYQYQNNNGTSGTLNDEKSYYARNYVNLYSVINDNGSVSYNVPKGSIFSQNTSQNTVSNFRAQGNFDRKWGRHAINAIVGGEVRSSHSDYVNTMYYGYNPNNKSFINVNYNIRYLTSMGPRSYLYDGNSLGDRSTRFMSLYTNMAYTFDGKYTVSGSARRDASNLFGLNTNDQWNPFWSTGLAWNISKEKFYSLSLLPLLKLRGSYGFSGNIDPAMVAVSTIRYFATSPYTQSQMAMFTNYYNPKLRWETTGITNVGVDFESRNQVLSGSVEWYQKKGEHLFGQAPLDYTTGITSLLWNVAGMKGQGWDIELHSRNINRKFSWNTAFNLSFYKDKITEYYLSNTIGRQFVVSSVPVSGVIGKPVYSIFAYQWAGLDPQTGDPRGFLNGEVSSDYAALTGSETKLEDLTYFGSAVPTAFGNFTNTFGYRNWNLDIGISYKLGYWFRRSSINYTKLFAEWATNSDYSQRWQQPGDERFTDVPSLRYETNSSRDDFYAGSAALVEKGDHVRLQYITLNYTFAQPYQKLFNKLQLYANISNLGILWKATDSDRDPDYNMGNFTLLPPLTLTLGLRANF